MQEEEQQPQPQEVEQPTQQVLQQAQLQAVGTAAQLIGATRFTDIHRPRGCFGEDAPKEQ